MNISATVRHTTRPRILTTALLALTRPNTRTYTLTLTTGRDLGTLAVDLAGHIGHPRDALALARILRAIADSLADAATAHGALTDDDEDHA